MRSLAKKTCVTRVRRRRLHTTGRRYKCLGVDLDGLHARLVRVAHGGLADGVVAAARAEHFVRFVSTVLVSPRGVLLLLVKHC